MTRYGSKDMCFSEPFELKSQDDRWTELNQDTTRERGVLSVAKIAEARKIAFVTMVKHRNIGYERGYYGKPS